MLKLSNGAKIAFYVGGLCSSANLAVYVARNILGSVSPQMIADGVFTESQIGTLSSLYFICYAVGPLILVWFGLMTIGVLIMLPRRKRAAV